MRLAELTISDSSMDKHTRPGLAYNDFVVDENYVSMLISVDFGEVAADNGAC